MLGLTALAALVVLALAGVSSSSPSGPRLAGRPTAQRSSGGPAGFQPAALEFSPTFPAVGIAAGSNMQNWSLASVDRELDDYGRLHARWIRHDFAWNAIEEREGVFTWSGFDRLVDAARARNINVIATIGYTPPWANGGHTDHRYAPTSAAQFGQFAGDVAARYAPRGVNVYEIWDEPNVSYWQPTPNPAAYTAVLCAAYKRIHAADPAAIVLTGGASPAANTATTYAPQTWLADLYADGARNCFDGVAYHPYVDSVSTPGALGGNWYVMYDAYGPHNLRTIMVEHGDSAKRIWATEVGCNRVVLGDAQCSARLAEAFALWRTYRWAAVLCWFTYWDPDVYGLVTGTWAHRPQWRAYQAAASKFS